MALNPDETELYLWMRSSLPGWFWAQDTAEEIWEAIAKAHQVTVAQLESWLAATYIETAADVWLNAHARDRGTFRQASETDAVLRARLKAVTDAVSIPAVREAVNKVLQAQGLAAIIEVPVGGWRYSWSVESAFALYYDVIVPAGFYTVEELVAFMNAKFHVYTEVPFDTTRAEFSVESTGYVTIDDVFGGSSNIYVDFTDVALRTALGFATDISDADGPYPFTAPSLPGGYQHCHVVELRTDRAVFGDYTPPSDTGGPGTFALVDDTVTASGLTATFNGNEVKRGCTVTLSSSTSAGNDGTFVITAVDDDSVSYVNPDGVAEAVDGWALDASTSGRQRAHLSRGYRMTRQFTSDPAEIDPPINGLYTASQNRPDPGTARGGQSFIVILPYGTTAATALGVAEALRQKKAGGITHYVERRANP